MPSFFQFTQGTESRVRPNDSSPLLGRFRAVPPRPDFRIRRNSQLGLLADSIAAGRGSVHVGYGALIAATLGDSDSEEECIRRDGRLDIAEHATAWDRAWQRWVIDLWVEPRQSAVKKVVDRWWSRYGLLVFMPATLVCLFFFTFGKLRCRASSYDSNIYYRPLSGVPYRSRSTLYQTTATRTTRRNRTSVRVTALPTSK